MSEFTEVYNEIAERDGFDDEDEEEEDSEAMELFDMYANKFGILNKRGLITIWLRECGNSFC